MSLLSEFDLEGRKYHFYDISGFPEYDKLPFSLRVILECLVRRGHQVKSRGQGQVWKESVQKIIEFKENEGQEILFHPSRVLLQVINKLRNFI